MRPRKSSLRRLALLAVVALIAVACAGGPRLSPISDPSQRLKFDGFSILPPRGSGWLMVEPPPKTGSSAIAKAYFIKRQPEGRMPPSKKHRLTAVIRTISLGDVKFENRAELLRHVAGELSGHSGKVYLDKCLALDCAKYEFTSEHRDNVINALGFVVLHPDFPKLIVNLEYRQYYAQGIQPIPVEALEYQVEPFQQSLEFRPLR